ncbi:MAG TPA: carbohydrate kinase family protein [Chloroflexia bacterium]|nr:carbohydrate kinase family protein [Chloroflexia bacterium]
MNILSMGDLLLDVVVRYDPLAGEADTGPDAVWIGPGGSAANFAVHAARLGAKVRFISRVGRDWPGEMLVRSLQDEGITTSVRLMDEASTGRVLVMVDPEGHRRMWSYPGASSTLQADDLETEWFRDLDAFHLTGYSLLREGPREAALHALKLAREQGAPFCTLDPNPPHLMADYGPARFRELLIQLRFDAIFPNLEEGRLLSGLGVEASYAEVATNLLDISPLVVLTLGQEGCVVASRDQTWEVPAARLDVAADATGAGDAFAAGFVTEYLRSKDAYAAATVANLLAARIVSKVGAR